MKNLESVFGELTQIYEKLGELSECSDLEFACDSCTGICCKPPARLNVSCLELDYIDKMAGESFSRNRFIDFINRPSAFSECPNYDNDGRLCRIHQFRPFCCRLFGMSSSRSNPAGCGYKTLTPPSEKSLSEITDAFILFKMDYFERNFRTLEAATVTDLMIMAGIFSRNGDTEKAARLYDRICETDPKSIYAAESQGRKYAMCGKWEEAARHYRRMLLLDPESNSALENLAYCRYMVKDYEEAIKYYKRALAMKENPFAYANLGLCHMDRKEYEKALEAYSRALSCTPGNTTYMNMKSLALYYLGQYEKSRELLLEAIALNKEDPLLYYCLANVCRELQELGPALEAYKKAESLREKKNQQT